MNKNRYRISEIISDLLFFTAGGAVYAAAVLVFLSSNKISPGGVTGIASVLNYLSGFPIGTAVFLLNLPLLLLGSNGRIQTLPLAVTSFAGSYVKRWDLILTSALLAMLPIIILFIFAQKYIIRGMVDGAVK